MGVRKGPGPVGDVAAPSGGPRRGRVWAALLLGGALLAGTASAGGLSTGSGGPVDPAPVDPTKAELAGEVSVVPDTLAVDGYRLVLHEGPAGERVDARAAQVLAEALVERRPRIHTFLDDAWGPAAGPTPSPDIEVHLHPTVESKALATGEMSVAHVDHTERRVHFSMQEGLEGGGTAFESMVLARDQLFGTGNGSQGGRDGAPAPPRALEVGLAVHLSDGWLGAEPEEWLGRLRRGRFVPSLARLLDDGRFSAGSMLALPPVAAVLVDWLVEERGIEAFGELYASGPIAPAELDALEPAWRAHLETLGSDPRAASQAAPARRSPNPRPAFQRGFNFAHEGYQIYNGYGSRQARVSLERMAGLGSNAVALVPYAFLRDPALPGPLTISNRVGSENDAAVLNSAPRVPGAGPVGAPQTPHLAAGELARRDPDGVGGGMGSLLRGVCSVDRALCPHGRGLRVGVVLHGQRDVCRGPGAAPPVA